jgi:hypothetical protein
LEEEEDEEKEEDEEQMIPGPSSAVSPGFANIPEETTPLLRGTKVRARRRRLSVGPRGNATVSQAVLMVCLACINAFRLLTCYATAIEIICRNWCAVSWKGVSFIVTGDLSWCE